MSPLGTAGRHSPGGIVDDAALDMWVEDTVAPYRDVLSPQMLEEMRVVVRATYAGHPVARQLIEEVTDRVPQQHSGVVAEEDAPGTVASSASDPRGAKSGGRS